MRIIKLTQSKMASVDDVDYPKLSGIHWHYHKQGYAVSGAGKIRMHRMVLGLSNGDGQRIDHINHNKLDNRRCNLRLCTPAQNAANSFGQRKSRSGFRGVHWDPHTKNWRVRLMVNGKMYRFGRFKSKVMAAMVYNREALAHYGAFAYVNPICQV